VVEKGAGKTASLRTQLRYRFAAEYSLAMLGQRRWQAA